jgi:hydroxymethylpyrimidine pyrophosphatase-like HAD family hydrolase
MLSAFPHSVAMGNAPPEVAALARYRTASNDQDGIAFALRRLFHLIP